MKRHRTFCGIRFDRVADGVWRSESGIELWKSRQSNIERWSVEENPAGRQYRGTGRNIREALEAASIIPEKK